MTGRMQEEGIPSGGLVHPRTRVGGGAQRESTADGEAKAVLERMGGAGVEREARNGVPPEGIPSSLIIMPIRVSVALLANSPLRPIIRWNLCLPHISPCRIDIKSATGCILPVNVAKTDFPFSRPHKPQRISK